MRQVFIALSACGKGVFSSHLVRSFLFLSCIIFFSGSLFLSLMLFLFHIKVMFFVRMIFNIDNEAD